MIPGTFRKPRWQGHEAWDMTSDEVRIERINDFTPRREMPAFAGDPLREELGGAPGELGADSSRRDFFHRTEEAA